MFNVLRACDKTRIISFLSTLKRSVKKKKWICMKTVNLCFNSNQINSAIPKLATFP